MALITIGQSPVFTTGEIVKRDLVRAQYRTWTEPRNGIVVTVSDTELTVLFLPGVHTAACYFPIAAQEVSDGKWSVLYTHDMKTIGEVTMKNDS